MSVLTHHRDLTGPDGIFCILRADGELVSTRVEDSSAKTPTPRGSILAHSKFHVVMATKDLVADLKRWASQEARTYAKR